MPVSEDVRHWHASPRAAIGFLLHAASIDLELVGRDCNLTLPGLCASVKEQIEALEEELELQKVAMKRQEAKALGYLEELMRLDAIDWKMVTRLGSREA